MASGAVNETVEGILSTQIPTCQLTDTTTTVLEQLAGRAWESANTVYVLDGETLVGRLGVTTLLRSTDSVPVSRLMEPASVRLHPHSDRGRAVYFAIRRDRDEIPVVDEDGHLVGVVTSQAIIDTMHREHLEDALLNAGIQRTGHRIVDLASARVGIAVRSRAPWLLFGLAAGLLLSVILRQFETTMQETIALAFFPPVIAYVADSVGTQSETIAVRAFAVMDVDFGVYLQRELLIGIAIGTILGVLGGIGATVIADSVQLGLTVGLALFVSSALATVLASLIPIGFILLDVDPALGSGPLATALQDIISIAIYFLIALALL